MEKYSGPDATLPVAWHDPQFSAPVLLRPHSAAPPAHEIRSLLWYPGYGSSAARVPEKHFSVAGCATRSPSLTYYSSATPPSTPRSNPDSPPPRGKIFLLPPRSALSAASSSAAAAAC